MTGVNVDRSSCGTNGRLACPGVVRRIAVVVALVWLLSAAVQSPTSASVLSPPSASSEATEGQPTDSPTTTEASPTAGSSATAEPGPTAPDPSQSTVAPTPSTQPSDLQSEPAPTQPSAEVVPRMVTPPAMQTSTIPAGSIALALAVLLVCGLLVRMVLQRRETVPKPGPGGPGPGRGGTPQPVTEVSHADPTDIATLDFLLELGRALIDAGDAITHVQETLEEVARVNGVPDVGVIALPTALIISLPGEQGVQTEVTTAGVSLLRLAQVDQLFRIVDQARAGRLEPREGLAAVTAMRTAAAPFGPRLQVLGQVLFTLGLVLLLRGGWPELALGAVLGVQVGVLQLLTDRLRSSYQVFLPVVAALGVSVVVLGAARVVPGLEVFPPLVAALVAFLPGALLTTAVFELSTGQIVSGSGRLAAGALRLVLLAVGILAGAQLVGVPAATIGGPAGGPVTVLAPWLGVAVFGIGVVLFKGARWSSLSWILLVLYVAYAGQVLGGLFVGSTLSAFVGALAMTPVAVIAARQASGPPALVSFLPGFWLLVPGAVGLQGVTRFLDEDTVQGVSSLVSMGTSMVGISLGVLLGLAIGAEVTARTGLAGQERPTTAPDHSTGPSASG